MRLLGPAARAAFIQPCLAIWKQGIGSRMVLTILLQSYLFGQVLQQSYSEVHNPTHNPTAFEINAPNPSTILLQSYLFGQVRQQSYYNPMDF